MKLNMTFVQSVMVAGVLAALITGCETPTIDLKMATSGEVKMNGVSKIALADFNSLPGDPFTGKIMADKETCALVKRAVEAAFYTVPTYAIVDLDTEKTISEAEKTRPGSRYDAIVYGRLWWQLANEASGKYPGRFNLTKTRKMPYTNKLTKLPAVADVTVETKDVIEMLNYRAQNATLMLTLSVYRLTSDGGIEKIADTYQVTNEGFTLMNGEMKPEDKSVGVDNSNALTRLQNVGNDKKERSAYEEMFTNPPPPSFADAGAALTGGLSGIAKGLSGNSSEKAADGKTAAAKASRHDVNGKLILTQDAKVAMPTELQAKLMLVASVTRTLSSKFAPTEQVFKVPAHLGEARVENLLKNGAYIAAKEYSLYMLRQKMGKQICEKLVRFLPEFADACSYPVPDSTEKMPTYREELIDELLKADFNLYFYTLGVAHEAATALEGSAQYMDKMVAYLSSQDLDIYFYTLGICCEAMQDFDKADEYYHFAFNVRPNVDYALGISRIAMAVGEKNRLNQTKKTARKAAAASAL